MNTPDPSAPPHSGPSLPEEVQELLDKVDNLYRRRLAPLQELLELGRTLNEARASRNRHQWRRYLRTKGISKTEAEGLIAAAKAGVTAEQFRDMLLKQAEDRLGLPPIEADPEYFGHDDHRDGEGDR